MQESKFRKTGASFHSELTGQSKQQKIKKDKLEERKETCSRQMKNHMVAKLKHYKSNSFYNIKASYYVCYDTEI